MSTATDMRDAYIAAEAAVLLGKTVEIGGRRLSLEDLSQIRAGRKEWERRVLDEARAASGNAGGFRYRSADFTGCNQ